MTTRRLCPEDHLSLRAFLHRHLDHAMFMASNLERSGIVAGDEPFEGQYWGAFDGSGQLEGVIALFWNGFLMPCAPERLDELATIARDEANRPIRGFLGERSQVNRLSDRFGCRHFTLDSPEALMALPLERLRVPALLNRPGIRYRPAVLDDLGFLVDWRAHYQHEAMNEPLGEANRASARRQVRTHIQNRECFVLFDRDRPVAMSGFNAGIDVCVQIGGVYTPPGLRGQGYGRSVVAGSLLCARDRGVRRSILFTGFDNVAAQRAYQTLGYERVGEFALKILPQVP